MSQWSVVSGQWSVSGWLSSGWQEMGLFFTMWSSFEEMV